MFKFRKLLIVILSLGVLISVACPAFATGITRDTAVPCEVTIQVKDITEQYPEAELIVNFVDVTNTVNETFTITKDECWGVGQPFVVSLPAPTTYHITFVNLKEGHKIIDPKTKEPVLSFVATQGNHVLDWSIESLAPAKEEVEIPASFIDYLPTTNRDLLVIKNEEAEKLYLEFLDAVSFITTDDTWYGNEELRASATLLGQYDKDFVNGKRFAENYEKYVNGGSIEQYNAMPAFEQFLWTECYTRLAAGVNHSRGWEDFFGNEANYEMMITRPATIMMTGNNAEVVKEAYMKLAAWQYEYVQANGYPFNFITNRSYIEEISGEPVALKAPIKTLLPTEPTDAAKGDTDTAEAEVPTEGPVAPTAASQALPAAKVEETVKPIEVEEKGIWTDTLDALADSMLTILILIVLAGGLGVVIFIRKRKNVDSDKQGGTFLS